MSSVIKCCIAFACIGFMLALNGLFYWSYASHHLFFLDRPDGLLMGVFSVVTFPAFYVSVLYPREAAAHLLLVLLVTAPLVNAILYALLGSVVGVLRARQQAQNNQ